MNLPKIFIIFILTSVVTVSIGQTSKKYFTLYGQVIKVDTANKELFEENTFIGGYKFFHDVFHLKVLTNTGDTLIIGLVYNIKRNRDSVLNSMGIKLGAFYAFLASSFMPCNSNFPSMYGCDCQKSKKNCELSPTKGKIFTKPYLSIPRVFDFFILSEENVQELFKRS